MEPNCAQTPKRCGPMEPSTPAAGPHARRTFSLCPPLVSSFCVTFFVFFYFRVPFWLIRDISGL